MKAKLSESFLFTYEELFEREEENLVTRLYFFIINKRRSLTILLKV